MQDKKFFSISDFAKLSRTTREALIHYDKIGLLKPMHRGKNNYRFYSLNQLGAVNLIHTCQELGMPLSEIETVIRNRTPNQIDGLLEKQIKKLEEKVNELGKAKKLLSYFKNTIHSGLYIDTEEVSVQKLPAETIMLGGQNDYSGKRDDYDALISFYSMMRVKYPDLDMNYPVWGWFSEERLRRNEFDWPDRYYFSNPDGFDSRPAGLYAVGYGHSVYSKSGDIFAKIIKYIIGSEYELCGPAYAEYPLNEISVSDSSQYLTRILITVREK